MLLAPGPVEMDAEIAEIASVQSLPYFRGKKFAETVLEVTENVKLLFQTEQTPLTVTASGAGLMEMAIVNLLNPGESVVVINGGTFGQKWADLSRAFHLQVLELKTPLGKAPDMDRFEELLSQDPKAVLLNMHETSTGFLFDVERIGKLTKARGILLIVDAVSAIGADEFKMDEWQVDCAMVSTQKALALLPGLGLIAFSRHAQEIMPHVRQPRFYFDALEYLKNIPRGITPFTPAMVPILQLQARLREIKRLGLDQWILKHRERATAFRRAILSHAGFGIFPERPSNALTAVTLPQGCSSDEIVAYLRDRYDWWFAPNPTRDQDYLRVSHMGNFDLAIMQLAAERIVEAAERLRQSRQVALRS